MKVVLAYITAKDKKQATSIGEKLVKKKIASCVNVLPEMHSLYHWKGKLEKAKEAVLIAKTEARKKKALLKMVEELHSYECPCVLFIEVKGGHPPYLKWLAGSLT